MNQSKKALIISIITSVILAAGCDTHDVFLEGACEIGCTYCSKDNSDQDISYICTENDSGVSYWAVSSYCPLGCDASGKCKQNHCVEGSTPLANGTCSCPSTCRTGCDMSGTCVDCRNGYKTDGSCACPAICTDGCDLNGACKCPASCTTYCNALGQCMPDSYEISVVSSLRVFIDSAPTVLSVDYLVNGEAVSESDLSAISMDSTCIQAQYDGNAHQLTVTAVSKQFCSTTISVYDNTNKAAKRDIIVSITDSDTNGNHLHDKYEQAKINYSCKLHSDCDSEKDKGDGFCDSSMGYQCTTRCSYDEQCIQNGNEYKFVCRSDGRCVPNAFITKWETTSKHITLFAEDQENDFDINWGDGRSEHFRGVTKISHDYFRGGEYKISITGRYNGWVAYKDGSQNTQKLKEIIAFGPVGLGKDAFANTDSNEIFNQSIDVPLLDKDVKSLSGIFRDSTFNGDISRWDTSNVTDMSYMFYNNDKFNQDISRWNTSNVTDMSYMFYNSTQFNQDISKWDTSNVTNMSNMFRGASNFNQCIDMWNTENVTNMSAMFHNASVFNQYIGAWNTSNVTDMSNMFKNAHDFNQYIGAWNTENVTDMSGVFDGASNFNQHVGDWKTDKVVNMKAMFRNTHNFMQYLGSWNTENVTDMSSMFEGSSYNQYFPFWNTVNVTNMNSMFKNAQNFDQDISLWNTKNVTDMSSMFENAVAYNHKVSDWNTQNVKNMSKMFYNATAFNNGSIENDSKNELTTSTGKWNTSQVTDMSHMFHGAAAFNQDISDWNTENVTSMESMFEGAAMFNSSLPLDNFYWNTQKVQSLKRMFYDAVSFNQPIDTWKFKSSQDTSEMFLNSGLCPGNGNGKCTPSQALCTVAKKVNFNARFNMDYFSQNCQ